MIQAVHDVAPGASLAFATAELRATRPSRRTSEALATAGADVIADDFIYFNEPFYQDSVISKAVSDVTAQGDPVLLDGLQQQPRDRGQRQQLVGGAGVPADDLPAAW